MSKSSERARAPRAKTRGLNPLAALAYVRAHDPSKMTEVLERLDERDLKYLSGKKKLTTKAWVPFMLQARLLRSIDESFGEGDLSALYDVGVFMANRDIPRVFRPLLKFGNPGWIIEVSTRLWRYYHSCGYWEVQRTPVSILCTLHEHDEADEAFCATFTGWLSAALEASGGDDVLVDHPVCHARGAPSCVFTCRWSVKRDHVDDETARKELLRETKEHLKSKETTAPQRPRSSSERGR